MYRALVRNFRWRQLTRLKGVILLGAVWVVIGALLIFAGHSVGILFASIGGSLIVIHGYIRGGWFRKPPVDRDGPAAD